MATEFDLVVRGGTLADGTGAALHAADVAVKDGKIAAVGKVLGKGAEEIDAKGLLVTPGFVDIHTHYDGQATWDSHLQPSSWHGVTTAVMGERAARLEEATPEEVARMRTLTTEAMHDGALGFSTSRTLNHRTVKGDPTP